MATPRKYHWPTDEGWIMVAVLTFAGFAAGGIWGAVIMFAFFAFVSILGNLIGV